MNNKQDILDIISVFESGNTAYMKLETGDVSIELSKSAVFGSVKESAKGDEAPVMQSVPAAGNTPQQTSAGPAERDRADTDANETSEELLYITSPMVGTFYVADAPGNEPFAPAGALIRKGEKLCLLEAMKMMNELTAPCDLIVAEVLKENDELAAFGDRLFSYRKV
ncbi:MAG: biotin/lipoyl-containing protein [Eubacteriales bacterium]|nr:biotin/lipoyl-containing protein [Eubacteriales bacterium]